MSALTRSELATLARNAGFTGKNVDVAVAIALAESSGNPSDHNSKGQDDSYGLWQINMIGSLGPDRRKRFNLKSNADLFDPATNARVAYEIWKSEGWSPWTTYTRGTYKEFLTGDASADADTPPPPTEDAGLFGIGAAINSFGETFTKGFASIGAVIVAVAFLVLGVTILLRSQVMNVIPGGKLAKVAKVAKGVSK